MLGLLRRIFSRAVPVPEVSKSLCSELQQVLSEIISVLEEDGETDWRMYMQSVRTQLESGDLRGVRTLLGAYGGMGSFNDLVIGQSVDEGQVRWREGHVALNDRLDGLRTHAYELAQEIEAQVR